MDSKKITTIKLNTKTKERIDKLKAHKRESYDEILQRMLEILNLSRVNPEKARSKLLDLERKKGIKI